MHDFTLFAEPWWVNLLALIPFAAWYVWRRKGGLSLASHTLLVTFLFALAFGFVEAAVVVYFRAALGFLPGVEGTLSDVARLASGTYNQAEVIGNFPQSLLAMELLREAATMVMLVCIALLAAKTTRERWGIYLWTFAAWDIFYYIGLWATVRWPSSLLSPDTLFLIPVPWFAQVWFPILVSALTIAAVLLARRNGPT